MTFSTLFIDLDDTVYDSSNGLWAAIRQRMSDYMQHLLKLPPDDVAILRRHYFETYGTTLRGLQIHNHVDSDEYLAYVHDLPLEEYLQPDPDLRAILLSLPQNKYIFTNADSSHAMRTIRQIGIQDCFTSIIDVRAIEFHCKPEAEAYTLAMQIAGETDASKCMIFDDSTRNLAGATKIGFYSVLVGHAPSDPGTNKTISNLKEIPTALPTLWDGIRTLQTNQQTS
jgi:putative hydrolase of the HAD superfamily